MIHIKILKCLSNDSYENNKVLEIKRLYKLHWFCFKFVKNLKYFRESFMQHPF